VGPYDSCRCTRCFKVVWIGCGPFNSCSIHVAASDSSGVASLG
jgi:hypothetical protein